MSGPITSTANPRVREAVALHRRRTRRERGRHLVEGPNPVREALRAGIVEMVLATGQVLDAVGVEVADLAGDAQPAVVEVADHVLARLADATTPQGVVAVARTPSADLDEVVGRGLVAVLDEVTDPGNVGAIVRTADAAGAVGVVLTHGSADVYAPKTVRAAAGSTYHLPIVTDVSIEEVALACRRLGHPLLGLAADGARSVFDGGDDRDLAPALVLGNEAHGLSLEAAAWLDETVAIPILGAAESLNVAAAAAIALYAVAVPTWTSS